MKYLCFLAYMFINLVNCRFFVTSDYSLQKLVQYTPFFVSMQPFSKALPDATRTFRKLRRDVSDATSGHNDYYVGTYQMLRRDVIFSMSSVKLQKTNQKA